MITLLLRTIENETDRQRFISVYEKYKNLMHYVARSVTKDDMLAEDAVQEAFIKVAKSFSRIKKMDEDHLKNLLALIAKNEAVSIMRKEIRQHSSEEAFLESRDIDSAKDDAFSEIRYTELKQAILDLPDKYRNLIYMVGVCELDLKEAASLLQISYETAKKRMQRARTILNQMVILDERGIQDDNR